jgi:hypothetical protein
VLASGLFLTTLSASGQATPAAAPLATAPAESDATAFLTKAREKAKATKDLSAAVETRVVAEGEVATFRADAIVVFSSDRFPLKAWRYELPAKEGESGPRTTVSGIGDRIYQLSPATKQLIELDLNGLPPMPQDGTFLLPLLWYIGERSDGAMFPGMPPATLVEAQFEADREVEGVRCRVVRLVRETRISTSGTVHTTLRDESTIAFGAEDLLPRHIRTKLTQQSADVSAVQEIETAYRNLLTNTAPADDRFRIELPEGYTRATHAPELVEMPSGSSSK